MFMRYEFTITVYIIFLSIYSNIFLQVYKALKGIYSSILYQLTTVCRSQTSPQCCNGSDCNTDISKKFIFKKKVMQRIKKELFDLIRIIFVDETAEISLFHAHLKIQDWFDFGPCG